MPKVSVIIATHNRAELLRRAIASVLAQTFQDFEIIVADDASQDRTGEVVSSLGEPRLKYLRHEENLGVANARNSAIRIASGAYLAFLDDDDEWLPGKLECQLAVLEKAAASVGAIYSGYQEVDRVTGQILAEVLPSHRGKIFDTILRQDFLAPTSTILVRAECFERLGGFDAAISYGEDFDMWLRIAGDYDFEFVPRPLAKIQLHESGLTQNYGAIIAGTEAILEKYREFFRKHVGIHSQRLEKLGLYYCLIGNLAKGRRLFCTAVKQNPLAIKSYINLILSMTGANNFKAFYALKDRVSTRAVSPQRVAGDSSIRGNA